MYPETDSAAQSLVLTVKGECTRVVRAGDPGACAVLLLHGWGGSAYNYRSVLPLLTAAGLQGIAPDLRGHGGSDKPRDPKLYTAAAMANRVAAVADAMDLRPGVVVGQSLGGAIVMDLARLRPDLVPAAVLLTPVGFSQLKRVETFRRLRVWNWAPRQARRWMVRLVLRRVYGQRRRWTEEDVEEYLAPLRDRAAVAALMSLVRSFDFAPRDPFDIPLPRERMALLFGALDGFIPWSQAGTRVAAFPGAHVHVLSGVGHLPAEEAPDEVLRAIHEVSG